MHFSRLLTFHSSGKYIPEHVGQVDPRVWVLHGCISTWLPKEATSLLEEAFHGTAARSAIHPDGDFVNGLSNGRLEDIEKRPRLIMHVNGHETRVHLADIKGDVGKVLNQVF
jgi:hypothetical protein